MFSLRLRVPLPYYMSESDPHQISGEVSELNKSLIDDTDDCVMMIMNCLLFS